MNLWRITRTEVAGAWRSMRYDMGRRPAEPPAGDAGPDVTSTGMSTFAVAVDNATGAPRRLVAVSAFGLLAVTGAAGTYFAMAGGLGSLLSEKPAEPRPYPLAAAAPPAAGSAAASTAGLGRGPAIDTGPAAPAPPAAGPVVAAAATPAAVPGRTLPRSPRVMPERAKPVPPRPCACPAPPVPTPTEPDPSPSASQSPSVSPSEPGSPSASASPSASGSAEALMRRSQSRGY